MSSSRIKITELSTEVRQILEQYRDDVADATDQAAQKAATECVKDIKSAASGLFNGTKYAGGWTKKQTNMSRGRAAFTVYNKTPGLPHLLENGHATVNGGRVAGRPHIAPAAEKATQSFQKKVEEAIRNV